MDKGAVGLALIKDTFREAFARAVFWGFYGLSTALILFFLFVMRIDVVEGARATISLFGQSSGKTREVAELVRGFYAGMATFLYTWGMALAAFASASLMPAMLERGRVELLLSKPVSRRYLLLGRYAGSLLVVVVNIAYLVFGVWLVLGWKTGIWQPGFLYSILTASFIFAVLLCAIALSSVLFESSALNTMLAFGLMIISPILAQNKIVERLFSSDWSRGLWNACYYALPKVYGMGRLTLNLVLGRPFESWMPVWSSALFGAVVLAAGMVVFSRRDY